MLSEAPPDNDPIIDDSFVELVWKWVSRNPEVTVDGEPHSGMVTESAVDEGEAQAIDGTKLDNMVHIAHNCRIGRHVVVAAQTGFSGGVVVED